MSSSCPYCGAVLKLKFCVVCGRQSKLNKMGHLRNTARNTDATARLEDPFLDEERDPQKSLRFHKNLKPVIEAIFGGLIAGTLIFYAARQAMDLYDSTNIQDSLMPWIKNHHLNFSNNWTNKPPAPSAHQLNPNIKKSQKNKGYRNKSKSVN